VDIASAQVVNAGGRNVTVLTFSPPPGEKPAVKADGAEITVGKQIIKVADGKLSLSQFTGVGK
jgi:hypothetical protein